MKIFVYLDSYLLGNSGNLHKSEMTTNKKLYNHLS